MTTSLTSRTARAVLVIAATFLSMAVAQSVPDSLLQQARRAEKAGDYASATRVYQQALATAPRNPEVLKRLGVLEQTELKFDDSIAHLRQALALNAEYP
ncbi:MAG TPA: tetratricopeptide repeat protein, partial [Candidatus Binatia bacterium]|nr:tetratricopeptide repeat protein [Candidatus Binatia bacterium]